MNWKATMKYMVLMYSDPAETKGMSAPDRDSVTRKHEALRSELTESRELLNGAGLAYPMDTKTIRLQDGIAVSIDGPLAEAAEQLTAYHMLDCVDRGRALSIAERMLDSHVTSVEVRQVHDSVGIADRDRSS
jgi:hypothetical protein